MSTLVLCRERLNRLLHVLDCTGGTAPIRDLQRSHKIWWWEVEQAAELGWVRTFTSKPRVGRPSIIAEKVSNSSVAKLPLYRRQLDRKIKWSHRLFATYSVMPQPVSNAFGFRMTSKTRAYMMAYPSCGSRAAAAVGASRLMKRQDIRLMRRWLFCEVGGEVSGIMPFTQDELILQLEPLGYIRRKGIKPTNSSAVVG